MFIPDPDFFSVLDPGSKNSNKREDVKTISCCSFFVAKKKIWTNLQRIIELSTQKIVIKL
jgi:hypothetical protein